MTDERIREARNYAVSQNINIIRNRVNQLGVAEPLVQRQGLPVLSLNYRVSKIQREQKRFSVQLQRWSFA